MLLLELAALALLPSAALFPPRGVVAAARSSPPQLSGVDFASAEWAALQTSLDGVPGNFDDMRAHPL
jgi:hypothetical protein